MQQELGQALELIAWNGCRGWPQDVSIVVIVGIGTGSPFCPCRRRRGGGFLLLLGSLPAQVHNN